MTFAATILTLYPEMFPGSLGLSLAGTRLRQSVEPRAKDGMNWEVQDA